MWDLVPWKIIKSGQGSGRNENQISMVLSYRVAFLRREAKAQENQNLRQKRVSERYQKKRYVVLHNMCEEAGMMQNKKILLKDL